MKNDRSFQISTKENAIRLNKMKKVCLPPGKLTYITQSSAKIMGLTSSNFNPLPPVYKAVCCLIFTVRPLSNFVNRGRGKHIFVGLFHIESPIILCTTLVLDYFMVRILKSRIRAGEILLTRGNGNFLATGFLFFILDRRLTSAAPVFWLWNSWTTFIAPHNSNKIRIKQAPLHTVHHWYTVNYIF